MFLVSPQLDFQTGPFSDFEQFKLNSHFDPTCFDPILIQLIVLVQFSDFGQVSYFTEFGQDVELHKTIQTSIV